MIMRVINRESEIADDVMKALLAPASECMSQKPGVGSSRRDRNWYLQQGRQFVPIVQANVAYERKTSIPKENWLLIVSILGKKPEQVTPQGQGACLGKHGAVRPILRLRLKHYLALPQSRKLGAETPETCNGTHKKAPFNKKGAFTSVIRNLRSLKATATVRDVAALAFGCAGFEPLKLRTRPLALHLLLNLLYFFVHVSFSLVLSEF
jgi:hypothetical protein